MKINLEGVQYYSGLGDIVLHAWLAEGCKSGPDPLVYHRTRNLELFSLLNLSVESTPGGICLDEVYRQEIADGCRLPRIEYVRRFLQLTTLPARPALHIRDEDEQWADQQISGLSGPLVLLFPQTVWKPREWPPNYWVDLAWALKAPGLETMIFLENEDDRYKNTPNYFWGFSIPKVAAMIKRAALVVACDSFPAHLAGVVGVPTIALMGPTRSTVFAHATNIECLASGGIKCTGCHFRPPFRAACDQGCLSLYRLFPEVVLRRVLEKLNRIPVASLSACNPDYYVI